VATATLLVLVVLLRALQYMLSTLLRYERPKAMALVKLKEAVATIVLFAVINALFPVLSTAGEILGYGDLGEMMATPPAVVESMASTLWDLGGETISLYTYISYLSSFSYDVTVRVSRFGSIRGGITFSNAQVYLPYVERLSSIVFSFLGALRAGQGVLCYVLLISIVYLLPLGLILRASGLFTRVGSTLIAVGITALLLPLFSHIVGELMGALYSPPPSPLGGAVSFLHKVALSSYLLALTSLATVFLSSIVSLTDAFWDVLLLSPVYDAALLASTVINNIVFALSNVVGAFFSKAISTTADAVMEALYPIAYSVVFTALYLFALAFFAVGLTRSLAIFLGGEYFLYRVSDYLG